MKKYLILIFACVFSLALVGCTTTQKASSGGALGGATIGGIIGHQSGRGIEGAAIGGAIGTLGGYIIGDKLKAKFCPVDGEDFDEEVIYCPEHGVELKYKEE